MLIISKLNILQEKPFKKDKRIRGNYGKKYSFLYKKASCKPALKNYKYKSTLPTSTRTATAKASTAKASKATAAAVSTAKAATTKSTTTPVTS
jgi:hypothetical protein